MELHLLSVFASERRRRMLLMAKPQDIDVTADRNAHTNSDDARQTSVRPRLNDGGSDESHNNRTAFQRQLSLAIVFLLLSAPFVCYAAHKSADLH